MVAWNFGGGGVSKIRPHSKQIALTHIYPQTNISFQPQGTLNRYLGEKMLTDDYPLAGTACVFANFVSRFPSAQILTASRFSAECGTVEQTAQGGVCVWVL